MLKKLFLFIILLFPISSLFAQNAITLIRGVRVATEAIICRRITTPISNFNIAANVALKYQNSYLLSNNNIECSVIEVRIPIHKLESPNTVYGPYNMMRVISALSKEKQYVSKRYLNAWKHINQTRHYNGAHHIINKSAIKLIHEDSKSRYGHYTFNLKDAQNNAPAMFHPLHGAPEFTQIFHNSFKQYQWYTEKGMKYAMEKQLEMIQELNKELGLPELSQEYIKGIMEETELWCKIYGLNWELFYE